MEQLSPKQIHEVNEILSADVRLPPPKEFAEVPEQHGGDDLLKRENESLRQKVAVLEEEKTSLRQKLDVCEKKLKDFDSKVEIRQLFNDFRHARYGRSIDRELMDRARKAFPSDFGWSSWDSFLRNDITSFSVMVIDLANLRKNLELKKETEDLNLPSEYCRSTESQINIINKKLGSLEAVAINFKKPEMRWDRTIGKEFFCWCLHVADANKICHRDIDKELLRDISRNAAKGEYKYKDVELGKAVQAVIRYINLQMASSS